MKLLVLGDSFTKGSELLDPETSCWPTLLSNKCNSDLVNSAEYGGSNDMMFRKAVEMTSEDTYDIVLIAWSEAHRMEIYLNEPRKMERRFYDVGPLSINHNWGNLSWTKEYYTNHYNEKFFLQRWLAQVVALQGLFKSREQKYLFMNAFGNQQILKKYNIVTKSQIDNTYFMGWPDEGFVEWTYGLPIGKYGHPLEEAHETIANKIYEYIRNLNWIS